MSELYNIDRETLITYPDIISGPEYDSLLLDNFNMELETLIAAIDLGPGFPAHEAIESESSGLMFIEFMFEEDLAKPELAQEIEGLHLLFQTQRLIISNESANMLFEIRPFYAPYVVADVEFAIDIPLSELATEYGIIELTMQGDPYQLTAENQISEFVLNLIIGQLGNAESLTAEFSIQMDDNVLGTVIPESFEFSIDHDKSYDLSQDEKELILNLNVEQFANLFAITMM